ncbi:uncharacterized [Tachysurus ichikawai]
MLAILLVPRQYQCAESFATGRGDDERILVAKQQSNEFITRSRILLWGAVPVSHSALNKESVIMVAKLKPTKSRKSQRVKRGSFQGLLYCSQRSKLQSPLTSHYVKLGK